MENTQRQWSTVSPPFLQHRVIVVDSRLDIFLPFKSVNDGLQHLLHAFTNEHIPYGASVPAAVTVDNTGPLNAVCLERITYTLALLGAVLSPTLPGLLELSSFLRPTTVYRHHGQGPLLHPANPDHQWQSGCLGRSNVTIAHTDPTRLLRST